MESPRPAEPASRPAEPASRPAEPASRPAEPASRPADAASRHADAAPRPADAAARPGDPADPAARPGDAAPRTDGLEAAPGPPPGGRGHDEARGLLLGLAGVAAFSLTLPMTRLAVVDLDPVWVGLARALLAAVPAAAWLAWTRAPRPPASLLPRLAVVAAGVIVGFPTFSSMAMRSVDASHGAVVLGVLPLATALAGAWLAGERPSRGWWAFAVLGAALVCAFALRAGGGRLQAADGLLALAIAAAAIGYAEGARLAQRLGGPQTICWTLVAAAPVLAPVVAWLSWRHGVDARPSAWAGFAYVTLFSQLLGFFAWYKGLAIGGIARVSQVQLLQTFMTLGFAAVLGLESPDAATWAFAAAVIVVVAIQRRAAVTAPPRSPPPPTGARP